MYGRNPEELCKRCMRKPAGPLGICEQCRIEVVGMHDHPVVRGYFKHNPRPSFYSKDIPEMSDEELWKFYEKTGSPWAFDTLSTRGLYASASGIVTESNPTDEEEERMAWQQRQAQAGVYKSRICPTCKRPVLTAFEAARGYQCRDCTRQEEGPMEFNPLTEEETKLVIGYRNDARLVADGVSHRSRFHHYARGQAAAYDNVKAKFGTESNPQKCVECGSWLCEELEAQDGLCCICSDINERDMCDRCKEIIRD